jgi:hypothetical protein
MIAIVPHLDPHMKHHNNYNAAWAEQHPKQMTNMQVNQGPGKVVVDGALHDDTLVVV